MSSTTARHIGVLLAAGRGSRMGRTKQLMPWPPNGDEKKHIGESSISATSQPATVVETSFDLIAPHCAQMIVVFGHDAVAIVEVLQPRTFTAVISDPDSEMMHSIRLGLVEAQRQSLGSAVLLHPADMPAVSPHTIRCIVNAAASTGKAVLPEHNGSGGHPVVIPASLIHGIVTWQGEGGLRAYWEQHPMKVQRVQVDDAAATLDLDTPADYHH